MYSAKTPQRDLPFHSVPPQSRAAEALPQWKTRCDTRESSADRPDAEGMIGGIKWKPEYYEVNVGLVPISSDYRDLEIRIDTDVDASFYVGEIGQVSSHYIEKQSNILDIHLIGSDQGKVTTSKSLRGLSSSWTVSCDKLRQGDLLELVIAVVNVTPDNKKARAKPTWLDLSYSYKARFNKPIHMQKRYEIKPPQ